MAFTIPLYSVFELNSYQGCDNYIEKYITHNKEDAEAVCAKYRDHSPDKTFFVEYTPDIIGLI